MALTFTSLGGVTLRVNGAEKPVLVFPADSADAMKDGITLLSSPEEELRDGVVSWPGEYNEAGVSLRAIGHSDGQQVSYIAEADGIRCAFLSSPLQDWTDKQLELAGDIDVLVLPTDDVKIAQKLLDEVDPRIVILLPTGNRAAYDAIAKLVGAKSESVTGEYKLKGSLPAEGREVVVLKK